MSYLTNALPTELGKLVHSAGVAQTLYLLHCQFSMLLLLGGF
jgi:hypothetical protein